MRITVAICRYPLGLDIGKTFPVSTGIEKVIKAVNNLTITRYKVLV